MLTMQRTHRLRDDRDWLPRSVRRAGRLASGGIWAGTGVALAGTLAAAPGLLLLWKGLLLGGIGALAAGQRAGQVVMQRQVHRMSRGEIELAEVDARAEGELVVVRGAIEVAEPLQGVLLDRPGVYRRMIFSPRGKWVHEAAVDFALIDERGHRLYIEAAGARWMVPARELVSYPAERFARPELPARLRELATGRAEIDAAERVLEPGTPVQIVGYKAVRADVTGAVVDYRLPPQRATLRSGPALPLVITALRDLA